MEFGRALGNDEPVIPSFPNSDYSTGVSGVVGVIWALLRREDRGASYVVPTSLNYYSQCFGVTIQTVKGIVQSPDKEVELRYNVGTRTNGVVELRWLNNPTTLTISLEDP
ncbi:uncharacterized protein K444DRAFT_722545 [Hyaloscypha bicolor E]|uniref:Uncharacterized protein n=1 Tax=Hyaloscypha bicolor E TaxID=1095630 RepID=A0A2J6T9U8_9HELO|nr:uncharacterized protein K444DRAFT_722545 [Hyaloscypha bicolor E]PMD59804.1 hypothetical protein K444DRAFT_722545 [Hyaloscypha bicolor E]